MNYPREKRDSEGNVKIVLSDNKKRCYLREGIKSTVEMAVPYAPKYLRQNAVKVVLPVRGKPLITTYFT